jgi:ribonuclease P protein component
MVLIALPNQEGVSRIGVTASRSVGKAVQRNRAKRVLRSVIQPYLPGLKPGWDIVLIARSPLVKATFQQTQAVLLTLMQRATLLQDGNDFGNS